MGFATGLAGLPLTGPLSGLAWLARRIAEAAEQERNDPSRIEAALLDLERQLEAGVIDTAIYEEREQGLLNELELIAHRKADGGHSEP